MDTSETPDITPSQHPSGTHPARRGRRAATLGVAAGLLGGGAIGLLATMPSLTSAASQVSATTEPSTTEPSTTDTAVVVQDDTSTDTVTDTDTDDVADTPDAQHLTLREQLQSLVDDGTITAAQADAVAEYLVANRPAHDGPGGHGHGGRPGFDGEVLAGLLGIDAETLRTELQGGKTVAEIATEQGVDVQTVIDALVAEATSHLQLAVDNGRLTQEEADAKLVDLTARITDRVNNGRPDAG
jgi:hypothetical protein